MANRKSFRMKLKFAKRFGYKSKSGQFLHLDFDVSINQQIIFSQKDVKSIF